MRFKCIVLTLAVVLAAVIAILLQPTLGSRAQAQQNCPSFDMLIQAHFPLEPPLPLRDGDGWGGNAYAYLGLEPLVGLFSGNDGNVTSHGWVGMGKGGSYKFAFGTLAENNTFTASATQATFPNPPGIFPAGGMYQAAWKITEGTGRFQNASGNLFTKGPYLVWTFDNWVTAAGRWNGEISGKICGVQ